MTMQLRDHKECCGKPMLRGGSRDKAVHKCRVCRRIVEEEVIKDEEKTRE